MRGVVVTGGESPPAPVVQRMAAGAAMVIAADSGLDTAIRCGVRADLVLGDFDSIRNPEVLRGLDAGRVRRYPAAKDRTDTELGIEALRAGGCDEIVIVGGGGGRVDHFIGILSLFEREPAPSLWVTDSAVLTCVRDAVEVTGRPGDVVSFFPLGCGPCSAVSHGLRWPLDGIEWRLGDIGVSNELTREVAEVRMLRGRLLMVRELEELL